MKKSFFCKFGNYSKYRHFTVNGYQEVKFCDIVKIWKKLENGGFSHKIFIKSHFKIEAMKIPRMTK